MKRGNKKTLILASVMMALAAMMGGCNAGENDGMLKISSSPADAEIYIDGDRKGNTPAEKGQTFAIKLSEGEHKVEIIKPISNPGKYDQYYGEKTVFVAEKSLQTVTLELKESLSEAHKKEQAKAVAKAIPSIASNMVTIPAGSFMMGSNESSSEKPVHQVQLKSFKMSKYEVTQAQWQAVMGENPSRFGGMNNPVEQVSWDDIQIFLGKLNSQTGKHFRLPSETEWEYAARAGSSSKYSWGDDVGKNRANCDGCGSQWDNKKTAPVGSFQPNAFGLYDMHGNVWEWVQDCRNDSYSGAPKDGSAWLQGSCNKRVLRGGSWLHGPSSMRSADRVWSLTDFRYGDYGFRLVQD